jgi:ABC-type sugar transport system substrate-binding protein
MVGQNRLDPSDRSRGEAGGRRAAFDRRTLLRRSLAIGLAAPVLVALPGRGARVLAQEVSCPPVATPVAMGTPMPASGKKLGVTVAYLSVPFYAGFKRGLEDAAR